MIPLIPKVSKWYAVVLQVTPWLSRSPHQTLSPKWQNEEGWSRSWGLAKREPTFALISSLFFTMAKLPVSLLFVIKVVHLTICCTTKYPTARRPWPTWKSTVAAPGCWPQPFSGTWSALSHWETFSHRERLLQKNTGESLFPFKMYICSQNLAPD